eukprot:364876-Chlamydomonas_euryale.AAC.12
MYSGQGLGCGSWPGVGLWLCIRVARGWAETALRLGGRRPLPAVGKAPSPACSQGGTVPCPRLGRRRPLPAFWGLLALPAFRGLLHCIYAVPGLCHSGVCGRATQMSYFKTCQDLSSNMIRRIHSLKTQNRTATTQQQHSKDEYDHEKGEGVEQAAGLVGKCMGQAAGLMGTGMEQAAGLVGNQVLPQKKKTQPNRFPQRRTPTHT